MGYSAGDYYENKWLLVFGPLRIDAYALVRLAHNSRTHTAAILNLDNVVLSVIIILIKSCCKYHVLSMFDIVYKN